MNKSFVKKLSIAAIALGCATTSMAYTVTLYSTYSGYSVGTGTTQTKAYNDMTNGGRTYCNRLVPKRSVHWGGIKVTNNSAQTSWKLEAKFDCV